MAMKIVPPSLAPMEDDVLAPSPSLARPDLRTPIRRPEPRVDTLIAPGFVTEAPLPEALEPDDLPEGITIEVPRRLKRALLAEVAARRDDPDRRVVASMKSVILEALAAQGFRAQIRASDIEVQAGIFMKRQAARLKRR